MEIQINSAGVKVPASSRAAGQALDGIFDQLIAMVAPVAPAKPDPAVAQGDAAVVMSEEATAESLKTTLQNAITQEATRTPADDKGASAMVPSADGVGGLALSVHPGAAVEAGHPGTAFESESLQPRAGPTWFDTESGAVARVSIPENGPGSRAIANSGDPSDRRGGVIRPDYPTDERAPVLSRQQLQGGASMAAFLLHTQDRLTLPAGPSRMAGPLAVASSSEPGLLSPGAQVATSTALHAPSTLAVASQGPAPALVPAGMARDGASQFQAGSDGSAGRDHRNILAVPVAELASAPANPVTPVPPLVPSRGGDGSLMAAFLLYTTQSADTLPVALTHKDAGQGSDVPVPLGPITAVPGNGTPQSPAPVVLPTLMNGLASDIVDASVWKPASEIGPLHDARGAISAANEHIPADSRGLASTDSGALAGHDVPATQRFMQAALLQPSTSPDQGAAAGVGHAVVTTPIPAQTPAVAMAMASPSHPPPAQQVVQAMKAALRQGRTGQIDLVLRPRELGQIRFEMVASGDRIHVTISAERPEAFDLIRRNAEHLMADLRQSGFGQATLGFGDWSTHDPARKPDPKATGDTDSDATAGDLPSTAPIHAVHRPAAEGRLDLRL